MNLNVWSFIICLGLCQTGHCYPPQHGAWQSSDMARGMGERLQSLIHSWFHHMFASAQMISIPRKTRGWSKVLFNSSDYCRPSVNQSHFQNSICLALIRWCESCLNQNYWQSQIFSIFSIFSHCDLKDVNKECQTSKWIMIEWTKKHLQVF